MSKRVVVLVKGVTYDYDDPPNGSHIAFYAVGLSYAFLLEYGQRCPEEGELLVLERTTNRPGWFSRFSRTQTSFYAETGKHKDVYTWRIVKEEDHG